MKHQSLIPKIIATSVILLTTFAEPSDASLQFCNRTRSSVMLAVGYIDGQVWTSKGWFNIAPSTCSTPISGRLTNRYYYYYGHDSSNAEWKGDHSFCTSSNAFTIPGNLNCQARGYKPFGFVQLDTGNSADYTLNLTSSSDPSPTPTPNGGETISRTGRREFGGVADCGSRSRRMSEADQFCNGIQSNLVASGYTILHRYDPDLLDSDSNQGSYCTDPGPFGTCLARGRKCTGWVEVRCRFQVRSR